MPGPELPILVRRVSAQGVLTLAVARFTTAIDALRRLVLTGGPPASVTWMRQGADCLPAATSKAVLAHSSLTLVELGAAEPRF